MGRVTIELLRKRSEHNEGEIQTLEELALHQEKIEKLENFHYCKNLKILLLQNNIIGRIENLQRLKNLEYLNLTLNNIRIIENLEGCESLKKLDLTLNFISLLSSVSSLKNNIFLEVLYLTGNPCCEYEGYREYVIAVLPQLDQLDANDISRSERIKAQQIFHQVERNILMREKLLGEDGKIEDSYVEELLDKDDEEFWHQETTNCPEMRIAMAKRMEAEDLKKTSTVPKKQKLPRKLFLDGRPLNVNEAKVKFTLKDDEENNRLVIEIQTPKFLDTSLINADVQPNYVTGTINKKIFQFVLPEEVRPDESEAQRSTITGHLKITMPKVYERKPTVQNGNIQPLALVGNSLKNENDKTKNKNVSKEAVNWREIVKEENHDTESFDFIDDPSVPPLI